jgi:hypothetical protein
MRRCVAGRSVSDISSLTDETTNCLETSDSNHPVTQQHVGVPAQLHECGKLKKPQPGPVQCPQQPEICPQQKTDEFHPVYVRSILVIYPRLRLGLPSALLPSCFDMKILHTSFSSPPSVPTWSLSQRAVRRTSHEALHYAIPSPHLFLPRRTEYPNRKYRHQHKDHVLHTARAAEVVGMTRVKKRARHTTLRCKINIQNVRKSL